MQKEALSKLVSSCFHLHVLFVREFIGRDSNQRRSQCGMIKSSTSLPSKLFGQRCTTSYHVRNNNEAFVALLSLAVENPLQWIIPKTKINNGERAEKQKRQVQVCCCQIRHLLKPFKVGVPGLFFPLFLSFLLIMNVQKMFNA